MKRFNFHPALLLLLLSAAQTFCQEQDSVSPFKLVSRGHQFPEGPAWDGKNTLFVSNCYGGYISSIKGEYADTFASAASTGGAIEKTNGLAVFRDGSLYACEYGKGRILRFSREGKCTVVCDGFNSRKFNRPNDLAFDKAGNLYFTDPSSYDQNKLDGVIYKIEYGKSAAVPVDSLLGFPNGIAFSPDGKNAFVCESALHRILKYDVNKNGDFLNRRVFAELPGGDPDGIACDLKGNLYTAHFGGGYVYIFAPDGTVLKKIKAPGKKPSNLEFGGAGLKTLFLTEDETNSVYSLQNEIPGAPLFSSPAR